MKWLAIIPLWLIGWPLFAVGMFYTMKEAPGLLGILIGAMILAYADFIRHPHAYRS